MAKKSFSFRIDPDNMEFLATVKDHGDNRALLVNHAIRMFRSNLKQAANIAYIFVPGTLFNINNNHDLQSQ